MQSRSTQVANDVTSVAGAGLRLALLLNAVACQVATLGVDIHSVSKGIALFSTSLKQLGQSLQAEHSVHTRECVGTAHQISDQGRSVFEEVEDMLDKVQKAEAEPDQQAISVQQRFKGCFKKQRVTYLLAQLESLKLSIMVMLQVLHLGRLQEVKSVLNTLTDELIVQERADAQNMLIVRYWSIKKLDRLWDLARQEASDNAATSSTLDMSQVLPKLPVISLGVDSSLSSMEESPGDMLRLTEEVLDALLKRWIRVEAGQRVGNMLSAYVSSGSEDELSDEGLGRDSMQGYFIEGVTTDWRRPHSQEARMKAAQLRKLYSNKQAHVHSDSDDPDDSTTKKKRTHHPPYEKKETFDGSESDDMPEQGQFGVKGQPREASSRRYSYSTKKTVPGCDAENHWRHEGIPTKQQPAPVPPIQTQVPLQSRPITVPQANINERPDRLATSQPARPPHSPSYYNGIYANPSSSYYNPTTASNGFPVLGTSTNASFSQSQQQPRYPQHQQFRQQTNQPYNFGRTMSDNSMHANQPQPQPQQFLAAPSPSSQPHRRRSSRNNNGSNRKNSRSPAPHSRHKDLKRTAMRGILGVSAIGGFMDALEAFSII